MAELKVVKKRIYGGIWEGKVFGAGSDHDGAPDLVVTHLGNEVQAVSIKPDPNLKGEWLMRVAIPPETLSDGVQVYVITERGDSETLHSFSVITGEPLEEDIRAEVELLRAELNMLKRAFRRHCIES